MQRKLSLHYSNVDGIGDVVPMLEGRLDKLPPLDNRNVRVFLSSTFSDMIQERNALMEYVYPKLKNLCREKYRLEFQMMDLRWGLREESQDDHTILEFCIREIENCKKMSLGPCFVALLGQKYGYRPFPATIEEFVFETIRDGLLCHGKDVSLLETWFKKDTNVVPPTYSLQPISSLLKHFKDKENPELQEKDQREWDKIFGQLLHTLRLGVMLCVEQGRLSQKEKDLFFVSVTEYEIHRGMFFSPNPNNTSFCITRCITNLEENIHHKRAQKFIDLIQTVSPPAPSFNRLAPASVGTSTSDSKQQSLLVANSRQLSPPATAASRSPVCQRRSVHDDAAPRWTIDRDAQQMLKSLQNEKIASVLSSNNITHFNIEWTNPEDSNPNENETYLQEFMKTFEEKMLGLIDRAVCQQRSIARNSHVVEILQHLTMCKQRSQVFRGRDDVLLKINVYLSEPAMEPLVLYGLSGSGKTSVLAKSASLVKHWMLDLSPIILVRFLGTTAQSCSIRLVLGNICWHLATLAGASTDDIPGDYPGLVTYFHNLMKIVSEQRPVVLFLDSLDQLTAAHRAHNLAWLPRYLPPNVHIILSTLPYEHDLLDTLRCFITTESNFIQILPLGQQLSRSLVKEWLSGAKRNLTAAQFDIVNDALGRCSLPLYTRLVFEEVCRWSSYTPVEQTMLEFTVKGIINKLFDKIEKYHGRVFVSHALSYLTASKNGLSDVELEDVLSLDEVVLNDVFQHWLPPIRRIPPLLIPRLHDELSGYIMQREANGTIVFYWYHRQFIFVARDRYLSDIGHRFYIHTSLSHYFLGTWGGGKSKPFTYSHTQIALMSIRRKENDLADRKVPLQPLIFGPDVLGVGGVSYNLRKLSELPFHLLESKQYLVLKQEVLLNYDWLYAKLSAMSLHDVLSDYRAAIENGIGDPDVQLVFSALRVGGSYVNQNPDTLAFDLLGRLLVYYNKKLGIRELLQQCDQKACKHSAILPLFQCFDSPRAMLLYVLEDHMQVVIDLLMTAQELISISKDGTIAFWDLLSGECTRNIDVSAVCPGPNTRLYLSGDGRRLVVDSDMINSPVYIYDLKTAQLLHKCGRRLPTQRRSFLVGNLLCRQKNIIDVRDGRIVKTLDDFVNTKRYVTCGITPDQKMILIGEEMVTKLFDFERGTLLATFPAENLPCVFVVTDDSRLVYVGYFEDCLFKVFDINPLSGTFGSVLNVFNYRTSMPGVKLLDGPLLGRELSEIAVSPTSCDVVVLNIKRTNLVRYNIRTHEAKLIDMKPINASNKTFLFGTTFSYNGKYLMAGDERFLHIWESSDSFHFVCTINLHSTSGFPIVASKCRNIVATGSTIHTAIKVWDLDKLDTSDVVDVTVYECPVDTMVCAATRRLVFVKNYNKGLQFVDSFGIDIWNVNTGNSVSFLPFGRYGKLLQMEVSSDGQQMALLLCARDTYITLINLKTNRISFVLEVYGCYAIHLSPTWDYLCTSSLHEPVKELKLWNCKTGELIVCFYQADKPAFTFDGKYLLYIDSGQTLITYCLLKMAPIRYIACSADQLLVLPVKHRLVLVTKWATTSHSPSDNMISGSAPDVTLWDFHEGRLVARLIDVAPGGIRDMSKDGRFAVDGFLQVFDLETGERKVDLWADTEGIKELNFVRLTYDGMHVVWVDKLSVKVSRVDDGVLIANTSTHERPTSLCVLDVGYVLVLGREDGRILAMKLQSSDQDTSRFACRPFTSEERTEFLLNRKMCTEKTKASFDITFQVNIEPVKDCELSRAGEQIRSVLSHRAKAPLLSTATRLSDPNDKYGRSNSHMPAGSDVREGSPITQPGSSSPLARSPLTGLVMDLDYSSRRGSSPCINLSVGDGQHMSTTEDSCGSASPSITSTPTLVTDKRSRSVTDLLAVCTLKPANKGHARHLHGPPLLPFCNTPRHRGPLSCAAGTLPRTAGGAHNTDLPPLPTPGNKFFGALLDFGATLRKKRKKSRTRVAEDTTNCRERMPSV